jgi:hypothetical protein
LKDYYQTLGVSHTASEAEIKRAFRKLAVEYHPDKNPDPVAQQNFLEINEAYDVIGDPQKRAAYDDRLANPWAGFTVEPEQPRHRDPAYHRPRPAQPRSRPQSETELVTPYLKYVHWPCRIGLLLTIVFFIDYFLPWQQIDDTVVSSVITRGRRGGVAYITSTTATGVRVRHYPTDWTILFEGSQIRLEKTMLYGTPMLATTTDGQYTEKLGHMYGHLMFLPLVVMLSAAGALVFRAKPNLSFNMSIVCIIFMVFTYVFI